MPQILFIINFMRAPFLQSNLSSFSIHLSYCCFTGDENCESFAFLDTVCPPSSGVYKWTLVVSKDEGSSMVVGVASTDGDDDNGSPSPLQGEGASSAWWWSSRVWAILSYQVGLCCMHSDQLAIEYERHKIMFIQNFLSAPRPCTRLFIRTRVSRSSTTLT